MKVLTDFHHHALAESLLMLFEDRYGWEVYFPYGMEWFNEGVWQHEVKHFGDAIGRQYLDGVWAGCEQDGEIVTIADVRHPGRVRKGITLAGARDTKWDVVLSSLPDNDVGLSGIAQASGARFGVQVGNNLQYSHWDLADFILASSTLEGFGPEWAGKVFEFNGVLTVMYHQEFSLETFRAEWPPAEPKTVASFVNCFPEGPSYPDFTRFATAHSDEFDFKVFGAYGTGKDDPFKAGDISLVPLVADCMRASRIGWHSKHWSDGFGHTVHNWFAIGRPVVGIPRYYQDKLAGPLFVEGVTSFDIESRSDDELATVLRRLRDDDDYHRQVSEASAARFREIVSFDAEADVIRDLLS